jgi:hypothetical protein
MAILSSLSRYVDGVAIKIMMGTLRAKVVFEYEKAGYSRDEALKLAAAEMMISLAGLNVNTDSYYEVRAWKKSYMAERARILHK